ncbi:MAG: hypothetical protein Q8Q09_08385 [Deltaproteobacteria bacterium]|nr:hypothetical protein [Deltaproteobacteria bacterium]
MKLMNISCLGALLLTAASACSPPVTPPGDVTPSEASADAMPDIVEGPYNSPLFGRCRSDTDCAFGATCKTESANGWSNGVCTRTCTTSSDCEEGVAAGNVGFCGNHNGERICLRECLNGFDCGRPGFNCAQNDPRDTSMMPLRVCRPSCTETSCVQGNVCNTWTGNCVPAGSPTLTTGQDIGQSCMATGMTNNCRSGSCIAAQNSAGVHTGWNSGYCSSSCTLTAGWNSSTLWPENTFPRANCPANSICFPDGDPGIAERDPGTCFRECRSDMDCRGMEGYACRRTFNRGNNRPFTWQNGICVPAGCNPAPGMPDTCPNNFYCEAQVRVSGGMRTTVGVCRPGMRPGPEPTVEPGPEPTLEAGVPDASNDVTTDIGTSSDAETDAGTTDASTMDASTLDVTGE